MKVFCVFYENDLKIVELEGIFMKKINAADEVIKLNSDEKTNKYFYIEVLTRDYIDA